MRKPNDQDDKVRELFAELRAETRAPGRAPDFETMIELAKGDTASRPPLRVMHGGLQADATRDLRSRRLARASGWMSAAIAAGVAALLFVGPDTGPDQEFDQLVAGFTSDVSGGAWISPTAGLLQVPGLDLLRGVPTVGGILRGVISEGQSDDGTTDTREGRL